MGGVLWEFPLQIKKLPPRIMTVRVNGMGHRALRKRVGVPLRAPHVLTPKESYGPGNPKGLRMLAHLTIQLKQRKHPGKLISAVPEGQGALPLLATCPFPQMCCLSLPSS